jgi:glycosyltransferase involved in cell wall biosynthesis
MKFSVAIPTFNRAHLIGYAIDSVLNQTYADVEIIVIDDGSTDNTADVVAKYGDRVRYYWQPNGGLGAARNAGVDRATGDWIAFLDSDDYWFDFKLALQADLLTKQPGIDFVFTEFSILKDDGRIIPRGSRTWLAGDKSWADLYSQRQTSRELGLRTPGAPVDFDVYSGPMFRHFLDEALVLPTTAIVRRTAIEGLRFTPGMTIFEDWEFFARLSRDHTGAFVDVETAVNRGHEEPGRLTRCSSLAKSECYLEILQRVWKTDARFAAQYPEILREAESAATLAVAESAVLAGESAAARRALRQWSRLDGRSNTPKAAACAVSSVLPGGRVLFRAARLATKLVSRVVHGSDHGRIPVNPAA